MSFWFWHGLKHGVRTTAYPRDFESAEGVSPGRPVRTEFDSSADAFLAAANCPVEAIVAEGSSACVKLERCIHCQRCHFGGSHLLAWKSDYEWTMAPAHRGKFQPLPDAYRRSLHVIVVDAGDCGACLHEVKQLNNPLYNMHRLGIFLTATPRAADVLLVVGPVSENMRVPLLKTYEAMPDPKRVVAVGACAIDGGVFGRTFMSAGGAASVLSVDLVVPGDPPPPLAILHGLLAVTGRKSPVPQDAISEGNSES
jgi:Ni,Fe-hydrogenase III small subunit